MKCCMLSDASMSCGDHMQAMVLTGGRSTRMGQDKSTLSINGRTLIEITLGRLLAAGHSRIVVLAADEQQKKSQKDALSGFSYDIEWVLDPIPHEGLIEALVSGANRSNFDRTLPLQLSPVDYPWLSETIYPVLQEALLRNVEVVTPADQRQHPLHSLVRSPSVLETLSPYKGPLIEQLGELKSVTVPWPSSELVNVNAPSDIEG